MVARSIKNYIERRVAAAPSAGSIKLPSPAPAAVPASANLSAAGQRSRLSQQVSLRNSPAARSSRRVTTPILGPDTNEDAEGEDDVEEDALEEGGDTEDKELYCFCRKLSYGEVRIQLISLSVIANGLPLEEAEQRDPLGILYGHVSTNVVAGQRVKSH